MRKLKHGKTKKKYRNKINNNKTNDEYKCKKENLSDSLENPTTMCGTVKGFMKWKKSGTPNKIMKDNILYIKTKDVDKIMNEFFIDKVRRIRSIFGPTLANFHHCRQAVAGKTFKMFF